MEHRKRSYVDDDEKAVLSLSYNVSKDESKVAFVNKKGDSIFSKLNNSENKENEKLVKSLSKSYKEDENENINQNIDFEKDKSDESDPENEQNNELARQLYKKEKIVREYLTLVWHWHRRWR